MKSLLSIALAASVALLASPASSIAQSPPPPPPSKPAMSMGDMHHTSSGWKELDTFHNLLAATWHPLEHSNDFKPIREKAALMADAAKAWGASKAPAACDTKQIRDAVASSVSGSRAVADLVAKQAPDSAIKSTLKTLHTQFEVAEEHCKPAK